MSAMVIMPMATRAGVAVPTVALVACGAVGAAEAAVTLQEFGIAFADGATGPGVGPRVLQFTCFDETASRRSMGRSRHCPGANHNHGQYLSLHRTHSLPRCSRVNAEAAP